MKNKIKKIGIGIGAALILMGARVSFSEPGTQSDPLVTFSYVETKIEELKKYINEKVGESDGTTSTVNTWQVIEVLGGQSIIGKSGTELILRSGKGKSISNISTGKQGTIDNGLTDVTDGKDLKMGDSVPKDHLLIIPRDDGRGVDCSLDSVFLVKGAYIVK